MVSEIGLREFDKAQECFLKALRLASEMNLIPCILDSQAGMAWIHAAQGREEPALELAMGVEKHSAVTQDTKVRVEELRLDLEARLTPEQIHLARTQAGEKNFDSLVKEILHSA